MKEKILALLIAAFSGVRKDGLNQLARSIALQATTEDEAKALVEKLTKAQVDEFVKEFRADVDKEVSESNKTVESNLKKKFDFVEKKAEPGGDDSNKGDNPNDIAAAIKAALAAELEPLKQELAGYKAGEVAKTRLQEVDEKLKGCKDEVFRSRERKNFQRLNDLTDEQYSEYLTDLEADIVTANQNKANSALGGHNRPFSSGGQGDTKEATKDELDAVLDKLPI